MVKAVEEEVGLSEEEQERKLLVLVLDTCRLYTPWPPASCTSVSAMPNSVSMTRCLFLAAAEEGIVLDLRMFMLFLLAVVVWWYSLSTFSLIAAA